MLVNVPRAQQVMREKQLDALVATTLENVFYLSGMWDLSLELFPHDAQAYVLSTADGLDRPTVVASVGDADMTLTCDPKPGRVITYGMFVRHLPEGVEMNADERRVWESTVKQEPKANAFEALCAAIEENKLTSSAIGVDERGIAPGSMEKLQERFGSAKIVPASGIFRQIRMVKTEEEQKRLIGALRATEAAIRATVAEAREGVTERELFHVHEQAIVANDARPGFTLLRFGKGMALGQQPSGDTQLKKGDYIWFDVGCTYQGYRSDIGRIFGFGEPDAKLRKLYEASKAGQSRAIELMQPGAKANDVFDAAVKRVQELGIPHYKRHHVGHGIGIEYYDAPVLAPSNDTPLEAGMVFEVETPYYEFGFGGAFIEDTVVVRENGAAILTTLSRELEVLPA